MTDFRTIDLQNNFSDDQIFSAVKLIERSGIICNTDNNNLKFKFDIVDLKFLENIEHNEIVTALVNELHKIKSYSSSNGKIVYASYNKDKKIKNKTCKTKKRLAYENFKKDFSKEENFIEKDMLDKIYCDDSLNFLKKLPDNSIDIILTSPPYNFGIDYNTNDDTENWQTYFKKLFNIFNECIRILKDSGRIIVNVQPMFSDYIPTHHFISKFFIDNGLIWKGEILWEKNNYNCKYCTWGSWKSPSAPYLKYSWEFIEVFCKNSLKKIGNKEFIDINDKEFKEFVYAKWSFAPERNMKKFEHDAMFPEKLVERCLKLFSYQNDIVLDPFNGAGTTTKVANDLNRHFIGIDIDEKYCETAKKRLQKRSLI